MPIAQFNLEAIHHALKGFQAAFPSINDRLDMRREDVSDTMIAQILEAYRFLNDLLEQGVDLFTPAGIHSLLEMNHVVLCGSDPDRRMEYYQHLAETRKRFLNRIRIIKEFVLKKRESTHPHKVASGFYALSLSQPQLFLEGNHRTGNILLNYLLVSKGEPPYVITADTALTYLNLSGEIKFSNKEKSFDNAVKFPGHRKKFAAFLKDHSDPRFLLGEEAESPS